MQNYDDGDKGTGRAYGHALVVGLSKEPRKVQAAPWPHIPSIGCPSGAVRRLPNHCGMYLAALCSAPDKYFVVWSLALRPRQYCWGIAMREFKLPKAHLGRRSSSAPHRRRRPSGPA